MQLIYLICLILVLASLLLTYRIRIAAIRHNMIDVPNHRSSHEIPTPRGGGIAIVICWFIGITILFYLGHIDLNLFLALLSGIILAVAGFADDLLTLPPAIRLIAQSITALFSFYFLNGLGQVTIGNIIVSSPYILYPVVLIGIIWFINIFNFLDGIDGYASLEAILIASVMFFLTGNSINLILIACVLGFLYWNWPKAKIFMGDIGSTQLGFILVVLGIYFHNVSQISIIHWIMLTSLFWFDATLTLFRRWRNKEQLSVAHRKHAYQRAVQSGLTHQETILLSLFINLLIASLVFISIRYKTILALALIINIALLYYINHLIDEKVPFKGLSAK